MTRHDALAIRLHRLNTIGVIAGWYCYHADGTRWVVWMPGFERTLSTREAELVTDALVATTFVAPSEAINKATA